MPARKALNNSEDEQIFFACLAYTSRQMRATLHVSAQGASRYAHKGVEKKNALFKTHWKTLAAHESVSKEVQFNASTRS